MNRNMMLPGVLMCLSAIWFASMAQAKEEKKPDFRGKVDTEILGDAPGRGETDLCTSPDGRRFAFWTRVGGKVGCLVDGEIAGKHDGQDSDDVHFSPDGKHAAWIAEDDRKTVVVYDGKPGKAYSMLPPQSLTFNPVTGQVVYVGMEGQNSIVVDGEKEVASQHSIVAHRVVVSPDGKRMAWLRRRKPDRAYTASNVILVIDGKETGPEYHSADGETLTFSPDGKRIAFVATIDKEQCCVVDGKPGEGQYRIKDITFSPDGQRVAYGAGNGIAYYVVVDGEIGPKFRSPVEGRICFSPDSKHVAYVGVADGRDTRLYLDGKEIAKVKERSADREVMAFSPDSSKFAWGVEHYSKSGILVFGVDGEKVAEYLQPAVENLRGLAWSPDSRNIAWFSWYSAYYNDQLIGKYKRIVRPLRAGFDDNGFWFVAVHEDKILRVAAKPAGTTPKTNDRPNPQQTPQVAANHTETMNAPTTETGPTIAPDGYRNWSDTTGQYHVEAKLVASKDGWVLLRTKDGRQLSLPISKLSPVDQTMVKKSTAKGSPASK